MKGLQRQNLCRQNSPLCQSARSWTLALCQSTLDIRKKSKKQQIGLIVYWNYSVVKNICFTCTKQLLSLQFLNFCFAINETNFRREPWHGATHIIGYLALFFYPVRRSQANKLVWGPFCLVNNVHIMAVDIQLQF